MARDFAQVAVVGLGTMGAGIAEVFAAAGLRVVGVERDETMLDVGRGHLRRSTDRAVSRGKLSADDQAALLERVNFTTRLEDLADAELVVEAIPERLDLKRDLFGRLDSIVKPETVLATNTSSLSVTRIASSSSRPGRVVGMHFFNPAPVQRLVEVVRTVLTDPEVVDDVGSLARRLGKSPVVCGDQAGFIANALLLGYLNRAAAMYGAGRASREDIDMAMTLGCGYPMGPLALLDLIGLDTSCAVLETIYQQTGEPRHASAPILTQLVAAGLLGRKTGRGFYDYADGSPGAPTSSAASVIDAQTRRIGVVGDGPLASRLAALIAGAGFEVVTSSAGDVSGAALADVDLAVEAVDDEERKPALLAELEAACRPGAILVTATSTATIRERLAAVSRPENVVGLHVVGEAGPIEVVRTAATAAEAVDLVVDVCRRAGRHPIVSPDRAGFVVNALLLPYLNDAVRMLEAGYASVDDIDTAMKLGCGLPAGPFEVLDEMGLDVALAGLRAIHRETPEAVPAPAPLLEELVTFGPLGRASGRGFRDHG